MKNILGAGSVAEPTNNRDLVRQAMDFYSDMILKILMAKGLELGVESIRERPVTLEKLDRFYQTIETKKPTLELIKGGLTIEGDEGMKLLTEKKYEDAVAYYKVRAKSHPEAPEGWFGLAACLLLTGDWKKCSLYYKKCIEADPNFDIHSRLLYLSEGETSDLYNLAKSLLDLGLSREVRKYLSYFKALAEN
jgi:tetratricopeptide (TPR) repeat protein